MMSPEWQVSAMAPADSLAREVFSHAGFSPPSAALSSLVCHLPAPTASALRSPLNIQGAAGHALGSLCGQQTGAAAQLVSSMSQLPKIKN